MKSFPGISEFVLRQTYNTFGEGVTRMAADQWVMRILERCEDVITISFIPAELYNLFVNSKSFFFLSLFFFFSLNDFNSLCERIGATKFEKHEKPSKSERHFQY